MAVVAMAVVASSLQVWQSRMILCIRLHSMPLCNLLPLAKSIS